MDSPSFFTGVCTQKHVIFFQKEFFSLFPPFVAQKKISNSRQAKKWKKKFSKSKNSSVFELLVGHFGLGEVQLLAF